MILKIAGWILLILFLTGGCETDPDIYIPSKPIPVIYAIFDDIDSLHNIVVTKSFGAKYNPTNEAVIYDSLYFKDIEVEVQYLAPGRRPEWQACPVNHITGMQKDSGFFSSPKHEYFQFGLILRKWPLKFVDSIKVNVRIPGYENIIAKVKIMDSITITTPKFNQHYIYLVPNSSLKIHWSNAEPWEEPHPWSEIDVAFEFIEELDTGLRSKWVHIQNTQYFLSPHELYRQLNITYEEFIKEVIAQLPVDEKVKRTFLGYISMHITGGDDNMVQYKKYLYGYTDNNYRGFSSIPNARGFLSSVTHFFKDSMRFDYKTLQTFINENRFKRYKISPWTESINSSGDL